MSRLRAYAVAALLLVGATLGLLAPAGASAAPQGAAAQTGTAPAYEMEPGFVPAVDRMGTFAADYVVDRDGGLSVTETISYSFDSAAGVRHGIFRSIVVRQGVEGQPDTSYRYLALSGVSASSPTGANTNVTLVDEGAAVTIKIGSASVAVSGTQTYVVRYHLANVLNPFTDSQTVELYYNVFTGDAIPKGKVTVSVAAPAAAVAVRCARGTSGTCQTATAGSPSLFAVTDLAADEDFTIATQYPMSAFSVIVPDIRQGSTVQAPGTGMSEPAARAASLGALVGGVLAPLLALGGMGLLVATRGRDEWYAGLTPGLTPGVAGGPADAGTIPVGQPGGIPVRRGKTPTIAVQFAPPPGVQPGLVGTIIDESADTIDVSATVIDLAVRGFMRIEEVAAQGMFARTDWRLTQLAPPAGQLLRPYEATLLSGIFRDGPDVQLSELKNHFATTLASVKDQMYDEVLQRHWFRKSPATQRAVWRALGFFVMGAGAVTMFAYGSISRGIDRTSGLSLPIPSGFVLGGGLLVAGFVVQLLGARMAAKTADGSAVLAQSLGFRQYLVTAEANQIRWEEAQDIFSRYLPFAIVFGVAERWAKTFQEVAAAAAAAGQVVTMPTWYIYQGSLFPDFGSIVDGVDSFSTTASGTFQSTPGSSGGSAFGSGGGFSGGGFSGGGGVGGSSSGSW